MSHSDYHDRNIQSNRRRLQRHGNGARSGPGAPGMGAFEQMHALTDLFVNVDEPTQLRFIDALFDRCHPNLIRYIKFESTRRLKTSSVPCGHYGSQDFTRILPRTISIRIFSYLDPKTLLRCAMVCDYWKYLSESNEVWKIKFSSLQCNIKPVNAIRNQIDMQAHGAWKLSYKQYMLENGHRCCKIRINGPLAPPPFKHGARTNVHLRPIKIPLAHLENQNSRDAISSDDIDWNHSKTRNHCGSMDTISKDTENGQIEFWDNSVRRSAQGYQHGNRVTRSDHIGRTASAHRPRTATHVAPWRPSAQHPEDLHFDKFGKSKTKAPPSIHCAHTQPRQSTMRPASSLQNLRSSKSSLRAIHQHAGSKVSSLEAQSRPSDHQHRLRNSLDDSISVVPKAMHVRKQLRRVDDYQDDDQSNTQTKNNHIARENNEETDEKMHWRHVAGGFVGFVPAHDGPYGEN